MNFTLLRSGTCAALLGLLLAACAPHTPPATDSASYQAAATNPAMQPVADEPRLPRVLLIEDSISIGYTLPVRHLLQGVANVHRIPENGGPTSHGLAQLNGWLGTSHWDVIHFNWGLHDLKLEAGGRHQVELDQYERNLVRLLDRLQRTGATLVWATTTPVPADVQSPRRDPADVIRYNDAARLVMEAAEVRINDLHAFAHPRIDRIQIPRNVHFSTAGSSELARPVAREIRQALKQRRRNGPGDVPSPASPRRDEFAARADWVQRHFDDRGRQAPFSFHYAGRSSDDFLQAWPVRESRRTLDSARTEQTLAWTDPRTGLEVRAVALESADYPVVEWTVFFRNTGTNNTPLLENLQGLAASFERPGHGEFRLHGIRGDSCTADSYEPYEHVLTPGWRRQFSPPDHSGKSCDGPDGWPYYNLQMPGGGVILAIGWPGQWASSFVRDADRRLRVQAGQQQTRLVLQPGEEIRTPLIALLFWKGDDVVRAQNLWRRWFVACNLARTRGEPQPTALQIQVDGSPANIAYVQSFLDAGIRPDICWRDAGGAHTWYPNQAGPYTGNDSWLNTGTWEVDPTRYPQGFKPFSDWVRSNGMQFLLWFEPERVGDTNSWLARNHPEWLLPGSSHGSTFNLGNTAAFRWLVDHLDGLITAQGLDWYREDMNGGGPLPAWRRSDAPDRQGITENLYVQGHLALWDELRRRHPGLRIDSCASGGRRNDLETMRRAVPLLRSDFQFPEMPGVIEGNQGHTHALSRWLPFQGTGCYFYEPYAFRSFYLPSFGMGGLTRENSAAQEQAYRECSRIAPLMLGDYYPLTPYNLEEDAWLAWQFDRPDLGMGVVQAFRRASSPEASRQFKLQGLQPGAQYETEDLDGPRHVVSGRQLMEEGLPVAPGGRPAATVVVYRRLAPAARTR